MFVIMVYDAGERRNSKVLKVGRKYLHWVQNSVFEGELTEANYRKLQSWWFVCISPSLPKIKIFIRLDKLLPILLLK